VTTLAKPSDLSDAALISRFLRGDEISFRALYQRHTPRLRMLVLRLLARNDAEADDVVQETWLAGCRGLRRFKGDATFATWLSTIAVRIARHRLRTAQPDDEESAEFVADPTPESPGIRIDLERAIARLPDHQRAIIVLHDVEGFTHAEIADQLGIPTGTSKVTLSRARATLRRLLTEGAMA
jgi:RNA polymerase sigma factor (sigma-70 family)